MYLNTDVKELRLTLGAKLTTICLFLIQVHFKIKVKTRATSLLQ